MQRQQLTWSVYVGALLLIGAGPAGAAVNPQCPGDTDGDGVPDAPGSENTVCLHLAGADGFIRMADGKPLYIFSFNDVTNDGGSFYGEGLVVANQLSGQFSAPTISLDQGQEFYLSLTNVGMVIRPDLFDPHTVHFHGFPNASDIFDGLPDATVSIHFGATLTYYYDIVEPGTYMYHCHVEATEHMQMGMLGNLYVRPAQNKLPDGTVLGSHVHSNPDAGAGDDSLVGDKYVFNDGDGSTRYDVEVPIQIGSMDGVFHDASEAVQPLPFADMNDNYFMLNGRGYPDTVIPGPLPAMAENGGLVSQRVDSVVEATAGERILLRISNLNVTNFYTLTALGLPMQVIGQGARILRTGGDPAGLTNFYTTNSVTLGGGEAKEVIIDTTDVAPGTYFLYTTNLNYLSNDAEDFGGMMTEIVIL